MGATCRLPAQDGTIVDSRIVQLTDRDVQKLKNADLELAELLEQIDIKAITYLSDELKVKGYMAIPKAGDEFPCVIYNRGGGNQVEAQLTDVRAAYRLGRLASYGYVTVATQYRGIRTSLIIHTINECLGLRE